jgi:hypothetical protein
MHELVDSGHSMTHDKENDHEMNLVAALTFNAHQQMVATSGAPANFGVSPRSSRLSRTGRALPSVGDIMSVGNDTNILVV